MSSRTRFPGACKAKGRRWDAVGGGAAQRGALRDRLAAEICLLGGKALAWEQLRYRVRYTVRDGLGGAVRSIKEATCARRPSARDSLQGQRGARMTIAEARAETSEQTGVEGKPGTVTGTVTGTRGWGQRRRCRRRRMLIAYAYTYSRCTGWGQLQRIRKLRLHHVVGNQQARWASDQGSAPGLGPKNPKSSLSTEASARPYSYSFRIQRAAMAEEGRRTRREARGVGRRRDRAVELAPERSATR